MPIDHKNLIVVAAVTIVASIVAIYMYTFIQKKRKQPLILQAAPKHPKRVVHVTLPYHDIWPQSAYNHPRPVFREYVPDEWNPYLIIPPHPTQRHHRRH
jgi:hypothetical protein